MANPMQQFEVKTIGPKIEIGNFDVSFTNSSLFMVIAVSLISVFFVLTTQKKSLIPSRLQLLSEMSYLFVAKMISETAGSKQCLSLLFLRYSLSHSKTNVGKCVTKPTQGPVVVSAIYIQRFLVCCQLRFTQYQQAAVKQYVAKQAG